MSSETICEEKWLINNSLIVHMDDIVIICDDMKEIEMINKHPHSKFKIKDLGKLRYFLGIEFARSKKGIVLSALSSGNILWIYWKKHECWEQSL